MPTLASQVLPLLWNPLSYNFNVKWSCMDSSVVNVSWMCFICYDRKTYLEISWWGNPVAFTFSNNFFCTFQSFWKQFHYYNLSNNNIKLYITHSWNKPKLVAALRAQWREHLSTHLHNVRASFPYSSWNIASSVTTIVPSLLHQSIHNHHCIVD